MYSKLSSILKEKPVVPPVKDHSAFTKAAVLVLLHQHEGQESVVLTKRSQEVLHHKGQVCFPGGVYDAEDDEDLWQTAVRETYEEIGVEARYITPVGPLNPLVTPSGYIVYPYVGLLEGQVSWQTNPHEIAEIFSVPLHHLKDRNNLKFVKRSPILEDFSQKLPPEIRVLFENGYEDPLFTFKNHEIWGATARIIIQLLGLL